MLPIPSKFKLVVGEGEGPTPLNAFDAALHDAGIGHLNLLRVSSILPPGARYAPDLQIPPGALVPTAYGFIKSCEPGQLIAAAIGVGLNADSYGVIMEFEGFCSREEAEARVREMVEEGFRLRGFSLQQVMVQGIEHRVKKAGSVIAAAVLWY